jgi:hypothetical protein
LTEQDAISVAVGGLCQITKKISDLWPLLLQGPFFILNYFLHSERHKEDSKMEVATDESDKIIVIAPDGWN